MNRYVVKQEDLIGEIKGFPIQIVQKMVDYQKIPNVNAFQKIKTAGLPFGFIWFKSDEGIGFWDSVINNKNFKLFFEKYPIMEDRNIKVNLETAREWFNGSDETLKKLALQAFTKNELNVGKTWEDYFWGQKINGFFIQSDADINGYGNLSATSYCKNLFKTKKQAESALAYAELTQLMAHPDYNGDWVPDWDDDSEVKHVIFRTRNKLYTRVAYVEPEKIAFKRSEIRDKFLNDFQDILKKYFEID